MNKFYYLFTICLLAFALSSCEKQSEEDNKSSLEEQELISKAIDFYEYNFSQECETKTFSNKKEKNKRINFRKDLDWDNAIVKKFKNGSLAVKVPVKFRENIYLDSLHSYMPLSDLTYVLIFKDESDCHVLEIVTTFPDPDYLKNTDENKKFKGVVYVESWDGEFLQSISYNNLGIFVNYNDYSQNETSLKTSSAICISPVDYYSCWKESREDMTWNCRYVGTGTVSEYCESSGGGDPVKPDSNTADKYKPSGGPSGDGALPEAPKVVLDSTFMESKADCLLKVLEEGGDASVMNKLLEGFKLKESNIDVFYEIVDIVEGRNNPSIGAKCSPPILQADGRSKITITLSQTIMNSRTFLETARTILHETFHAHLFGMIDDPTLYNSLGEMDFGETWKQYKIDHPLETQHNWFAENYIPYMTEGLRKMYDQWDHRSRSVFENYISDMENGNVDWMIECIAWGGLLGNDHDLTTEGKSFYEQNGTKYDDTMRDIVKVLATECPFNIGAK